LLRNVILGYTKSLPNVSMSWLTISIISRHCSPAASAVLKHLHNVDTSCCCPQTFLSLDLQCMDVVSGLEQTFRDLKELCVPPGFGRAALDFGLAAGLSVSGLYGPLKQWRERQLSSIFASGQTLRLQFPKEDLGFVYNTPGAAICPETDTVLSVSHRASAQPQPDSAGADATAVNTRGRGQKATRGSVGGSDRRYRPSCTPGSRLPHCTLRQLKTGCLPCPCVDHFALPSCWPNTILLCPALLQTSQPRSTIPTEDVACFCCCFVQHVCSAAMLPCLSGVCLLLLAFCLVVINVIFFLAEFSQRWTAVYDVHVKIDCCHKLH